MSSTGKLELCINGEHCHLKDKNMKIEISSNGQNCSILSHKCPELNCISIMMGFLTYITGFFMNFELLPILIAPILDTGRR
jgi:hypothetical protein